MEQWDWWKEQLNSMFEAGTILIMATDRLILASYPLSNEHEEYMKKSFYDKVFEIRLFNANKECHLIRGDVRSNFKYRVKEDINLEDEAYYDDEQYLDIDAVKSEYSYAENRSVYSIGGGNYHLPFDTYRDVKIKIRNYIAYEEYSGQAYIEDWRLVTLFRGEVL